MAYAGLLDGGLSVKIGCASNWTGGTERRSDVHELQLETTSNGVGFASFWMEVSNPFNPQATYGELAFGARVLVTHTYDAVTTPLYRGFIISDPRSGYAGERGYVQIECAGPVELARLREDVGFVYTERDTDQWFANKRNGNWVTVDTSDGLYIGVGEGTKVPFGPSLGERCGAVGYVCHAGAEYLYGSPQLYGVRRIRGKCRWNLQDNMDGKLCFATAQKYIVSRDKDDYTTIKAFNANTKSDGWVTFDTTVGGWNWVSPAAGAAYLAVLIWPTERGVEVKDDRFIEFDNLEMYLTSDGNEKSVSGAMLDVANFIGLHNSQSSLNATVESVEQSLVARAMTNPIAALSTFAAQADKLVEWGWFVGASGIEWRCRPLPKAVGKEAGPTGGIRYQDNCYKVSAATPGITWEVNAHPEDGVYKAVRLCYGKTAQSIYPKDFPKSVIAPPKAEDAGGGTSWWASGKVGMGTNCPVLTVDFSAHNYSDGRARRMAAKLAEHLGSATQSGRVIIQCDTVPIYRNSNPWPAAYIKGGDFIECTETQATTKPGPLYITRSVVSVDSGRVELEVGYRSDDLIRQLEGAGGTRTIELAKRRRIRRR